MVADLWPVENKGPSRSIFSYIQTSPLLGSLMIQVLSGRDGFIDCLRFKSALHITVTCTFTHMH